MSTAKQRQHHADREVRHRVGRRIGRVHDDDAALPGCCKIDVINARSPASDHPQFCRPFEHQARYAGCRANQQRVRICDCLKHAPFITGGKHGDSAHLGRTRDRFRGIGFRKQEVVERIDHVAIMVTGD